MYHFSAGQFSELAKLSTRQKGDVELGLALIRILWRAGADTGSFDLDEVRRRGRCLLVSSALVDVLHHLGLHHARCQRLGINVTTHRKGALVSSTSVGHPAASPVGGLWNAHMTVRLGDLLFDPTFAQMLGPDDPILHAAVFRCEEGRGSTFLLDAYREVHTIASSSWSADQCRYTARLFHLPRSVDLATRNWRGRPDAMPERRAALVARALELTGCARKLGMPK